MKADWKIEAIDEERHVKVTVLMSELLEWLKAELKKSESEKKGEKKNGI
jgi:hypothetical protein